MFTHVTMVLFIVIRGVIVPKFDRKLKYLSNFPSKGPYYNCNNDIWNWHKITCLAWTSSWSRGLLRVISIKTSFTSYFQSHYSTDDNKNHQNGFGKHASNFWWCENKSSWLYSRIFLTVAPRSLVGPHFLYIMMAIEGGNSTEAT